MNYHIQSSDPILMTMLVFLLRDRRTLNTRSHYRIFLRQSITTYDTTLSYVYQDLPPRKNYTSSTSDLSYHLLPQPLHQSPWTTSSPVLEILLESREER